MSKSKEELNELKKQYEELNKNCQELTVEELEQVTGGTKTSLGFFGPAWMINSQEQEKVTRSEGLSEENKAFAHFRF